MYFFPSERADGRHMVSAWPSSRGFFPGPIALGVPGFKKILCPASIYHKDNYLIKAEKIDTKIPCFTRDWLMRDFCRSGFSGPIRTQAVAQDVGSGTKVHHTLALMRAVSCCGCTLHGFCFLKLFRGEYIINKNFCQVFLINFSESFFIFQK